MTTHGLDQFSKALAMGASRRQVLKVLAATAAGGAFAFLGVPHADAQTARCETADDCPSVVCQTATCAPRRFRRRGRCVYNAVVCQGQGQVCCTSGQNAGECRGQGACN